MMIEIDDDQVAEFLKVSVSTIAYTIAQDLSRSVALHRVANHAESFELIRCLERVIEYLGESNVPVHDIIMDHFIYIKEKKEDEFFDEALNAEMDAEIEAFLDEEEVKEDEK